VFTQTLEPAEVQVVAVDDGSTDGGGAELDRLAAGRPGMTVIHQPNSGGPGGPRNTGIAAAAGEYVFFLDADDWLGPEALARMCAMADQNGTDVVLGKYVGVNRKVPQRVFDQSVPFTTLADPEPDVYGTLAAMKLYRRRLLVEHDIRFPEGVLSGEDQIFTAHAYLHATGMSVVGDHDCYFWAHRDDGTSIMQNGGAPAEEYFPRIDELFELVERHTRPGPLRDRLYARHVEWDVLYHRFGTWYLDADPAEQRADEAGARSLLDRWLTPGVATLLPPHLRLLAHCLAHGLREELRGIAGFLHRGLGPAPLRLDGDRAYLAYPYFGTLPDECYDYTERLAQSLRMTGLELAGEELAVRGETFIWRAPTESQAVTLLLRSTVDGDRRFPGDPYDTPDLAEDGYAYPRAGFEARLPVTALPPGRWDPFVEIAIGGIVRTRRLGAVRDEGVAAPEPRLEPGRPDVSFYFTDSGNLRIRVGSFAVTDITWAGRDRLRVRGRVIDSRADTVRCELRRRGTDEVIPGETAFDPDGQATLEAGLRGAGRGLWDLWCEAGGEWRRVAAPGPLPASSALSVVRRAEPYRTAAGMLTVRVAGSMSIRRVRSMLRHLKHVADVPT
jgi:hypothetical protein